ncbi:complement component receptor 1-like protein isoform X2 [Parambassis ranga]|uniref:Complement component receptor 1-like protein isoform X2 n=1 Tax=Parambassis ranga TaxID=210632 RepID=A0A6P7IBW3_9TELE|nr:complement component receptor 1-like protein isoform X2 [Parambassis ranga]
MRTFSWSFLVLSFVSLVSALKDCSAPPEYPHTKLAIKHRQRFSSGEKIYYKCDEDFTPYRGSRSVECSDGEWSKLSLKCEKRSCGYAGNLLNGHFDYEGNSYIGEKVYAVCDEGYTLKGPHFLTCKKSGWTGEFPTCEEGETTCSTPAVANTTVQRDVSVHHVGEKLSFTCSPGFQLDGAPQVTCGSDGQWQPRPPRCIPEPVKPQQSSAAEGGCGVPPAVTASNANLANKFFAVKSFFHGAKVYYTCDVGYVAARGSRMRQCFRGQWTPLQLRCERRLCGTAGEVLNGHYIYSGAEFGDTATAVCDEGHHLVGRATRRCMSKGWDGRLAVCEAVECAAPSERTNAELTGVEQPSYTYRSVIGYKCSKGTLIGQKEIWCTTDGTWSAPPPQCKEVTCPPPNVHNAYWMGAHKHMFQAGEIISIECAPGLTLMGSRTITCNGGRWLPRLPTCQRMTHYAWTR